LRFVQRTDGVKGRIVEFGAVVFGGQEFHLAFLHFSVALGSAPLPPDVLLQASAFVFEFLLELRNQRCQAAT